MKLPTEEIGMAIAAFCEGKELTSDIVVDGHLQAEFLGSIEAVITDDPNNLILMLDNGQLFTIRIIAKG